jgi:hypothetical protein
MTTIKRFDVGETKCDEGSGLLIGCGNDTIITLVFDNKRTSHADVHTLDRLITKMGLIAVEVQTGTFGSS